MQQYVIIVWLLVYEWRHVIAGGLVELGYRVGKASTSPSGIPSEEEGKNWTFPLVLEVTNAPRTTSVVLKDLETVLAKSRISFSGSAVMCGGQLSMSCGKMWPEQKKTEGEPYR